MADDSDDSLTEQATPPDVDDGTAAAFDRTDAGGSGVAYEGPFPTASETLRAWAVVALGTTIANVVVFLVAAAVGAELRADIGATTVDIGLPSVIAATAVPLLVGTVLWAAVGHRVPAFADLWVPLTWGFGLVSLAMIIGASGVATGVSLGIMHMIATVAAAHALPRVLPRQV